jgi:twitching motility two-component system response regulator PilG
MDKPYPQSKSLVRALVVDDSATVRNLIELVLKPIGVQLDCTDNGEDAIALAKNGQYDIIFLDVMLPGMDGYRVCKIIKADSGTRATPVVMLTSKDSAIDKVRGIMAGTNVYLTKPFEKNELLSAFSRCLPWAQRGLRTRDIPASAALAR